MKYCIAIGETTGPTIPLLFSGNYVDNIRKAKQLGFDAVEIHTPNPDSLDIDALLAVCKEQDMFIATLGTGTIYGKYGLYLMDQDDAQRNRLVEMVKAYIDAAQRLGSKVTIGSIKGNVPKEANREAYLQTMGMTLQELDAYAKRKQVTLLLEATNRFENNVINTGRELYTMIEQYALHNTQALIDSFHINIEEASIEGSVRDVGKHLGHIHFADNTRHYPGSGAFCFDAFCHCIRECGYDGVLSVECFPLPDGETAARETIRFFQRNFG